MLKKELTVPGAQIKVRMGKLKDGVTAPNIGGAEISAIRMMQEAGSFLNGHARILPGEILTVVRGPKKTDGINTTIVERSDGLKGHVYWCELRVNCDHI